MKLQDIQDTFQYWPEFLQIASGHFADLASGRLPAEPAGNKDRRLFMLFAAMYIVQDYAFLPQHVITMGRAALLRRIEPKRSDPFAGMSVYKWFEQLYGHDAQAGELFRHIGFTDRAFYWEMTRKKGMDAEMLLTMRWALDDADILFSRLAPDRACLNLKESVAIASVCWELRDYICVLRSALEDEKQ